MFGAALAVGLMAAVAIEGPLYQQSEVRFKERALKNTLFTLRTVIDEYTSEKKKPPVSLNDLVSAGYLYAIPVDPMTGTHVWRLVNEAGLFDVRSGSDLSSLDGTAYSSW